MSSTDRYDKDHKALLACPEVRIQKSGSAHCVRIGAVGIEARTFGPIELVSDDPKLWEFTPNAEGLALGLSSSRCRSLPDVEMQLAFQLEQLSIALFGSRAQALAARAEAVTGQSEGYFAENWHGTWNLYFYTPGSEAEKYGTIVMESEPLNGQSAGKHRCRFIPTDEGLAVGFEHRDAEIAADRGLDPSAALGHFFDRVVAQGNAARMQRTQEITPGMMA